MSRTHGDHHLAMSDLLEQYIVVLQAAEASPDTIAERRRCILRLHEDLPHGVLYACTEQLQAWLSYQKWSRWTRYTYWQSLNAFYSWLQEAGYRPDNPMDGTRRPKAPACVPRPALDEEIRLVLSADDPIKTAAHLAYYMGFRRKEIVQAYREDFTEEMTVIPSAKGGDVQTVPTHPAVWELVRDRPAGPLIVDEYGRQMTREQLSRIVRAWARRNGIIVPHDDRRRTWGLHRLRHSFGTEIQRRVGNLEVTRRCLRHKSIHSTVIYTAVSDNERIAAVKCLPRIEPRPEGTRPGPTAAA